MTAGPVQNPSLGRLDTTAARGSMPDGTRYAVIETTLPAAYIAAQGAQAVIAQAAASEASNLRATVLGTRALQLAGATGAEVVLGNATSLFRVRIYIFDHSTVEVGLGGTLAAVASASADTFLASLAAR